MFIIWGTRNIRRHRGYVADFCAICRAIKPFRVQDITLAHHVFFLPIAKGEVSEQMLTCRSCGQQSFVEPGTRDAFVDDPHADIDTLVRDTNPTLPEDSTDRLVLEEKAKASPTQLTPGERTALLTEPFMALSSQVTRRFAPGGCSNVLGALALLVGLFLACLWIVYNGEAKGGMYALVTVGGVFAAVLVLYALWSFATSKRRYMKRRVVPLLAQALAPLEPTQAELAEVLDALEADGHKIGEKVKPEWVLEAIRMAQTVTGPPPAGSSTTST